MLRYLANEACFFLYTFFKKNKEFKFYKGFKKVDLLIYDDVFPHPVSGFRLEEISMLLSEFKQVKLVVSFESYQYLKTPVSEGSKHLLAFNNENKSFKSRILLRKGFININAKLFYCIFLNNIADNLKWLEKFKIPFVFTLYPGGGFEFYNQLSDQKLKNVLSSKMLRSVIVTQKITQEYLVTKELCAKDKIKLIFGCVVPQLSLKKEVLNKKTYLLNKKTFDICFCAAKYMPKGEDKGYDVFIALAHNIALKFDFVRFHVIGGFTKDDIDIAEIESKIKFYGYQNFENLEAIFKNNDIIISPNKPFLLNKGSFDGFPLGTVVEAMLNENVALVTDQLKQNYVFNSKEELIIIEESVGCIEKEVIYLIENPKILYSIAEKGRKKVVEIYSNEYQMRPRIEILKNVLEND
ncbi:glycosyltransferase [Flavobacterium ginsengiterrae]|uniref:Glycosyltransferase n=1 Tax=Flavobacterium ginsengiterrae TaxID=871695 RepID=A0ABP7H159_9FLAO